MFLKMKEGVMKSTGEIQSPETIELPGEYLKAKRKPREFP
jgi:hypothetical protein